MLKFQERVISTAHPLNDFHCSLIFVPLIFDLLFSVIKFILQLLVVPPRQWRQLSSLLPSLQPTPCGKRCFEQNSTKFPNPLLVNTIPSAHPPSVEYGWLYPRPRRWPSHPCPSLSPSQYWVNPRPTYLKWPATFNLAGWHSRAVRALLKKHEGKQKKTRRGDFTFPLSFTV